MLKIALIAISFGLSFLLFPELLRAGQAEKQLVAQCIGTSGGMPAAFAACAVKGLAFNELKNCLIGEQIGTTCMGQNNFFIKYNNWFNRTILGNCGFRAIDAVQPQIVIINNTDVAVDIDIEFEDGPGGHSVLNPGYHQIWTLDWCDTWINLDWPGGKIGWDAGSVIELAYDDDGVMRQFSWTPSP